MNRIQSILVNHLTIAVFCITLLGSCKKENTNNTTENPCYTPNLSLSTSAGTVSLYTGSSSTYGFFEVEYGANGFTRGNGTTKTISGNTDITGLTDGTYDFYIRGNCGGTAWSDWSTARSCLVSGNPGNPCSKPTNLTIDPYSPYQLRWDYGGTADFYQVEYGLMGFTLGTGTRNTVNNRSFSDGYFSINNNYEYYVRAYCGNNQYSDWEGPKSFHAVVEVNPCQSPSTVYINNLGGGTLTFTWTENSQTQWETVLLNHNAAPSTGRCPTNR